MSRLDFDNPQADAAVLQQLAYDSNYTEDISVRMRVPDKLTVASRNTRFKGQTSDFMESGQNAAFKMDVPERIVISVGESGVQLKEGETRLSPAFDAPSATAIVALKTPPRTLTLQEQGFDEDDNRQMQNDQNDVVLSDLESSRPCSSAIRQFESVRPICLDLSTPERNEDCGDDLVFVGILKNLQSETKKFCNVLMRKLKPLANETSDTSENEAGDSPSDQLIPGDDIDEVTLMRKQVFKLHKRISLLEKQQAEQLRRDYIIYGISAVFWLLNGWFLYNHRRLY